MARKPWPTDRVQVICATQRTFVQKTIRGERLDGNCADCGQPISFDSFSIDFAVRQYKQFKEPPKTICIECLATYESNKITDLRDLRKPIGDLDG